ncbi:MAG: hypothetical protein ACXVP0_13265 [Bacteroidia bacterium]
MKIEQMKKIRIDSQDGDRLRAIRDHYLLFVIIIEGNNGCEGWGSSQALHDYKIILDGMCISYQDIKTQEHDEIQKG